MFFSFFFPRNYVISNRISNISCTKSQNLTHLGRVTHICVSKLTIIGSDNGLTPRRRQAITWTSAGILLIRPLETKFSENLIEIHMFSFKKMHLKMSSVKWRLFCLPQCVKWSSPRVAVVFGVCPICRSQVLSREWRCSWSSADRRCSN